jgi:C1A family cysteine protease
VDVCKLKSIYYWAYTDAQQRRITGYQSVADIQEMTQCLDRMQPVVIGIYVFTGYDELPYDHVIPMPVTDERIQGAHAVAVMGYSRPRRQFLAKNSYGPSWALKGYFWLPFEYITLYSLERWCFEINDQSTTVNPGDQGVAPG